MQKRLSLVIAGTIFVSFMLASAALMMASESSFKDCFNVVPHQVVRDEFLTLFLELRPVDKFKPRSRILVEFRWFSDNC